MTESVDEIAGKWLEKAERDFKHAEMSVKNNDLDWARFACQQSAEKALKAASMKAGLGLSKTHDLTALARRLKCPKEVVEACGVLNSFYTAARYPDFDELLDDEALMVATNDAIFSVRKVLEWCRTRT